MPKQVVGRVEDLPPGSRTLVEHGGYGIGVFNVNGAFYALNNYCPHRGAPLCRGEGAYMVDGSDRPYEARTSREGEFLRCPWHGWEFEIESGTSVAHPKKRVRTYAVVVEDGLVILETGR